MRWMGSNAIELINIGNIPIDFSVHSNLYCQCLVVLISCCDQNPFFKCHRTIEQTKLISNKKRIWETKTPHQWNAAYVFLIDWTGRALCLALNVMRIMLIVFNLSHLDNINNAYIRRGSFISIREQWEPAELKMRHRNSSSTQMWPDRIYKKRAVWPGVFFFFAAKKFERNKAKLRSNDEIRFKTLTNSL